MWITGINGKEKLHRAEMRISFVNERCRSSHALDFQAKPASQLDSFSP